MVEKERTPAHSKTSDLFDRSGVTSPKKTASTSKKGKDETITLKRSELDEAIAKASTDGGRKWKGEAERLQTEVTAAIGRVDAIQKDFDNLRLEAAKDDTTKTSQIKSEITGRTSAAESQRGKDDITKREEQLKADREEWETKRAEEAIPMLATKYNLKPKQLEELKITDFDTLERVAKQLAGEGTDDGEGDKGDGGDKGEKGEEGEHFEPNIHSSTSKAKTTLDVKTVQEAPMEEIEEVLAPKPK